MFDFNNPSIVADTHWNHIDYSKGRYEGCKKLRIETSETDLEKLRKGIWKAITLGGSGTNFDNYTIEALGRVIEANCILCDCHGNKKLNELVIRAAKWFHQHPEAYGSKYEVREQVVDSEACPRCNDRGMPEFMHVFGGACMFCGRKPSDPPRQPKSTAKPDPNTHEFVGGILRHAPAEERAKIKQILNS